MNGDGLKARFIAEVVRVYRNADDAVALLEHMHYPEEHRPNPVAHNTMASYWNVVIQGLVDGLLPVGQGLGPLAIAASAARPSNSIFREAVRAYPLHGEEEPEPEEPAPPVAEEQAEPDRAYHTVVFIGSQRHARALRLVRELLDPHAELAYTTAAGVCAVIISEQARQTFADFENTLRSRAQRLGDDVEVELQETRFRPYVYETLTCQGPDNQLFEMTAVPASTVGGDLGAAVMGEYSPEAARDGQGRRRRVTIDRVGTDGREHRVRQNETLHANEVQDGDTFRVAPESTAGVPHGMRTQAIATARSRVRRYADKHANFRVLSMNDDAFPTEYVVEFDAPGLVAPEDPAMRPFEPGTRNRHKVKIQLPDEFPLQAPTVRFVTPIFHPNIVRETPVGQSQSKGEVCLGVLKDQYRPSLDFGRLCELIVDLASFQNYEIRAVGEDGEGLGYVDALAAAWVKSEEGQRRIEQLGGQTRVLRDDEPSRREMPLLTRRMDATDGD